MTSYTRSSHDPRTGERRDTHIYNDPTGQPAAYYYPDTGEIFNLIAEAAPARPQENQ